MACNGFKDPVEIGDAIEPAVIGDGGDAVIVPVRQLFARFVDPDLVEEGDEGVQRMFFEIAAEGLGGHMRLFGHVLEGNRFVEHLHDVIINGANTDTFVFAVGGGLSTGREWLELVE